MLVASFGYFGGPVYVNDTVSVTIPRSAVSPPMVSPAWGWIEKEGLKFLRSTLFIERVDFKIMKARENTYYLESVDANGNEVRLAYKTENDVTYVVLGKGDYDLEVFFVPYSPRLAMSTDA
ncbi:hypothetical protein O6H91_Y383800 [Diphasiastrum complanatum]|nr:hypothetical protein O6H91_Y383800 [Diphasiastrum complanatum]